MSAAPPPQPAPPQPTLTWAGDRYLRIDFGGTPNPETLARVHAAHHCLRASSITGLIDLTPAYTTLLLAFDLRAINTSTEQSVRTALDNSPHSHAGTPPVRNLLIPVCYSPTHGEDLEDLARTTGLTIDEVITLHTSADYTVAFIGFTPGFPYLTGLTPRLATPRLPSPRSRIPTGSIGIAGSQTGIYPGGTPGGWRLIGRTPLRIFDSQRDNPAVFRLGDRVRFESITAAQFGSLTKLNTKETA